MALRVVGGLAASAGKDLVGQAQGLASQALEKTKDKLSSARKMTTEAADNVDAQPDAAEDDPWNPRMEMAYEEPEKYQDPRDKVVQLDEFNRMALRHRRDYRAPTEEQSGRGGLDECNWNAQRRFRVRMCNVQLQNVTKEPHKIFLDFHIGSTLIERRVKDPRSRKVKPMVEGYAGRRITTPVAEVLPNRPPTDFSVEKSFEWRGSYAQLERETAELQAWLLKKHRVNELLSSHEASLRTFANSSVSQTILLDGLVDKKRQAMFRLSFEMQFEEIYDFGISLVDFRLTPKPQKVQILSADKLEAGSRPADTEALLGKLQNPLKVRFRVPQTGDNQWPKRGCSPTSEKTDGEPHKWPFVGNFSFRGTQSELEAASIQFMICSGPRILAQTSLGRGTARLREVLDNPKIECDIMSPEEGNVGVYQLEGSIAIPNRPKYRQTGRVVNIDESKLYLFVKPLKVDDIITKDCREHVDSYAEVHFAHQTKQTAVVLDTLQPYFQSDLLFPIDVKNPQAPTKEEISKLGNIRFDIWAENTMANDHVGWSEIHLSEILFSSNGTERPKQTKTYFSSSKSKDVSYETRVFQGSKKLVQIWDDGSGRTSKIFFEVWTKPDLGPVDIPYTKPVTERRVMELDAKVKATMAPALEAWDRTVLPITQENRQFQNTAFDQWGKLHLLSSFVSPIAFAPMKGGSEAEVPRTMCEIHHFIRSIPYDAHGDSELWITPDFFLHQRQGTVVDHVLLHCSLLLGLKIPAFVCLGTLWNQQPHAWVATFSIGDPDEETEFNNHPYRLMFWDPYENTVTYVPHAVSDPIFLWKFCNEFKASIMQPNHPGVSAFISPEKPAVIKNEKNIEAALAAVSKTVQERLTKDRVTNPVNAGSPESTYKSTFRIKTATRVPYRSIDIMFNHDEVFANLQLRDPLKILYDFWDRGLWHPLVRGGGSASPSKSSALPPTSSPSSSTVLSPGISDLVQYYARPLGMIEPLQFVRNVQSGAFDTIWASKAETAIYDAVQQLVNKKRYTLSKTSVTRWLKDPESKSFLETGAKLLRAWDTSTPYSHGRLKAEKDFNNWRSVLLSRTPTNYRLRWAHIQLPFASAKFVAVQAWNRFSFLHDLDATGQFTVGVWVVPMPNRVGCVYVVMGAITRLKAFEIRKLNAKNEADPVQPPNEDETA